METVESPIVPNVFSVASARLDERESRESRPGGETKHFLAHHITDLLIVVSLNTISKPL